MNRSAHLLGGQNKAEKYSNGMDWLLKGLWYGPANLNNRMSENVQISDIYKLHRKSHEKGKVKLTSEGKTLAEVKIQRGLFQENSLSPLLLVLAMIFLRSGYKFTKSRKKINSLVDIDDIKLFAKNEREMEILIQTIRIYSQDVGIDFGIEKCTMLIIKSGKGETTRNRIANLRKHQDTWRKEKF